MVANMIPFRRRRTTAFVMAVFFGAAGAYAQGNEPALLGEFGDWSAYTYNAADTKVCYVSSRPKASEPKTAKRDPIFFLVTHMPGRSVRGEVSTIIGYPFKKESSVQLAIDEAKFEMRTDADGAWAEDAATDKKIVATMKGGKAMTLQGTSWRGTVTIDTYSLTGLSAAMAKIDEACK
jgi:invasion protein IalB